MQTYRQTNLIYHKSGKECYLSFIFWELLITGCGNESALLNRWLTQHKSYYIRQMLRESMFPVASYDCETSIKHQFCCLTSAVDINGNQGPTAVTKMEKLFFSRHVFSGSAFVQNECENQSYCQPYVLHFFQHLFQVTAPIQKPSPDLSQLKKHKKTHIPKYVKFRISIRISFFSWKNSLIIQQWNPLSSKRTTTSRNFITSNLKHCQIFCCLSTFSN